MIATAQAQKAISQNVGRFVRQFQLSDHDRDDLTQDAYVRLLTCPAYDPARGAISTFVFAQLGYLPRRLVRERQRACLPIVESDGSENPSLAKNDSNVSQYLGKDEFRNQVIIGLSEGKSKKDIASSLGTSVKEVKAMIAKLKRELE